MPALLVECERCGHQHHVQRAGQFSTRSYLELWHELHDREDRWKAERNALEQEIRNLRNEAIDARADLAIALTREHLRKYYEAQLEAI